MPPSRADLELAMQAYWGVKDRQGATSELLKSTAEGAAKSVRAGKQFAPVAALIARFFIDAGYPPSSIGTGRPHVVLPGAFRPTKQWDLVVVHRGVLVAAFELKGIGGDDQSIGKNYNNRVEEALGSAFDIDQADDLDLMGPEPPWLGYLFVMEDTPSSRKPKEPMKGLLRADDVWSGLSYQQRFSRSAQRLLSEKLYAAVCYLVSSRRRPGPDEPCPATDWQHFSASIEARIHYLSKLGYP